MSYSTPAMVRVAVLPGSDGEQSTGSQTAADLADDQLCDAIAEADSTIDAYIGAHYAVPVAVKIDGDDEDGTDGAVPHPIDYWSRNIAAYNATLTQRKGQEFDDTDPIARRYTATMTALTNVMKGQATLQLPDNASANAGVGVGQNAQPYFGTLFGPGDFDLHPMSPGWPFQPDIPADGPWNW